MGTHGTWLVIDHGTVHSRPDRQVHGEHAHWHIHHTKEHGTEIVSLRNSATEEFLCANEKGHVYLSTFGDIKDAKWFLERVENRVAIRSPHGGYLGAMDPNMLEKIFFVNNSHVRIHPERGINEVWEEDTI